LIDASATSTTVAADPCDRSAPAARMEARFPPCVKWTIDGRESGV
jgi:hypothetical protein